MARYFGILKHDSSDKEFGILTPDDEWRVRVDYDDVNHPVVDKLTRRMVTILNDHWNDPEYQPKKRIGQKPARP